MHSIKLAKLPYALDVICNLHFCQTEKQLLLFLFVKVCIKVAHKLNLIKYSHHVFQLMLAKLLHYISRTILLNPVVLCCTMHTNIIFCILFILLFQNDIELFDTCYKNYSNCNRKQKQYSNSICSYANLKYFLITNYSNICIWNKTINAVNISVLLHNSYHLLISSK